MSTFLSNQCEAIVVDNSIKINRQR